MKSSTSLEPVLIIMIYF